MILYFSSPLNRPTRAWLVKCDAEQTIVFYFLVLFSQIRFMNHKFTGKVVIHCHILNHEDTGMMMTTQIVNQGIWTLKYTSFLPLLLKLFGLIREADRV